jgi:hypothetical protein
MIVALPRQGEGNGLTLVFEKRLDIELNIGKDILQIPCGQGVLEVFHAGSEALSPIRGIDIVLEHGILIV